MSDSEEDKGMCFVCKQEVTTVHTEAETGLMIFVCEKCLEKTKQNFIWICLHCGSVYIRPKELVLKRVIDPKIKEAYRFCESLQMVQGLDQCIECAPEALFNKADVSMHDEGGGHC